MDISFDPILGKEARPWNSYWHVYDLARRFYRPGQTLLDFGCGSGVSSIRYARIGYTVHGFDICQENVDACRALAIKYGHADQTSFSVETAEALPFADERFDTVFGIDILHHVEIARAIQEVRRVLKPGGRAVFREWIETPAFERFRNAWVVRLLFPKGMSLDGHITQDERKLNRQDIDNIVSVFPAAEFRRFCITSRLRRIIPIPFPSRASRLEQLDYLLMKWFPRMQTWGGETVIILQKTNQSYSGAFLLVPRKP